MSTLSESSGKREIQEGKMKREKMKKKKKSPEAT
jgi:hypothetical protein